jgi:type III secretion protein U
VVRSRELAGAAALLGGLAALAAAAPLAAAGMARSLRQGLSSLETASATASLLRAAAWDVARWSLPAAAAALLAGALASLALAGPGLSPEALRPRWDRIDPAAGLRRLLSPGQAALALLGLLKAAALVAVALAWLRAAAAGLSGLPRAGPAGLLRAAPLLFDLALRLAAASLAFGLGDAALARWRHLRSLRMTRDEVRREQKDDEGDPLHRAERRRRHRALLEAGPVARATVVVVNPSHLAVALRHARGSPDAPRVVAKGAGRDAAAIRSAARRSGVPIVRDVPLARALHRLAEVGDEIPEELYDAAAALLVQLYRPRPEDSP